jgi:hypothetical protein
MSTSLTFCVRPVSAHLRLPQLLVCVVRTLAGKEGCAKAGVTVAFVTSEDNLDYQRASSADAGPPHRERLRRPRQWVHP